MLKPSFDNLRNKHVIVTGLPKSGTSLIADILHCDLAISMGTSFAAPLPGTSSFEFEDEVVSAMLTQAYIYEWKHARVHAQYKSYYMRRASLAKSQRAWGLKSPLALIYNHDIRRDDSIVIKTKRDPMKSFSAIAAKEGNDEAKRILSKLITDCTIAWPHMKADIVVDFDERPFDRIQLREFLTSELQKL